MEKHSQDSNQASLTLAVLEIKGLRPRKGVLLQTQPQPDANPPRKIFTMLTLNPDPTHALADALLFMTSVWGASIPPQQLSQDNAYTA